MKKLAIVLLALGVFLFVDHQRWLLPDGMYERRPADFQSGELSLQLVNRKNRESPSHKHQNAAENKAWSSPFQIKNRWMPIQKCNAEEKDRHGNQYDTCTYSIIACTFQRLEYDFFSLLHLAVFQTIARPSNVGKPRPLRSQRSAGYSRMKP